MLATSPEPAVVGTDDRNGESDTLLNIQRAGEASDGAEHAIESKRKLGTLTGVYLPCLQNILGVILFLRLPFITGQAGTLRCSAIVLLCTACSLLTALSMSAIATNGKVERGGPYFLLSRNLGAEWGGSIGILFYLGTSVAVSLYVLGAVEALREGFAFILGVPYEEQVLALLLLMLLTFIVAVGVKYVNMASTLFLTCVLLSVFSILLGILFFVGGSWAGAVRQGREALRHGDLTRNLGPNYTGNWDFGSLVALFFPSVTGIMAGANRSDVLRNPERSIPVGTLGAILTTTLLYMLFVWLFGAFFHGASLRDQNIILTAAIAWPSRVVVNVGIIMSCIGAALQTLTGAPRLLAAIAADDILPILEPLKVEGDREPRAALAVTWLIASLPCLAGNLDLVTPWVTLCFLTMYCTMNLACFLLSALKEPTWRPVFNNSIPGIRRGTALCGVVLCFVLMFWNSPTLALIIIALTYGLMRAIAAFSAAPDWGDSMHGLRFNVVWSLILRLQHVGEHAKNWKPRLLLFAKCDALGEPNDAGCQLLAFAAQLRKGRGLLLVRSLLIGDIGARAPDVPPCRDTLQRRLEASGCEGCADVVISPMLSTGLLGSVQGAGLGEALSPNTLLMSWPKIATWRRDPNHAREMQSALFGWKALSKTILFVKHPGEWRRTAATSNATLDLWWVLHDRGHPLMIAYLLRRHPVWANCRLRIFALQPSGDQGEPLQNELRQALNDVRISADVIETVHMECTASELGSFFGAEERYMGDGIRLGRQGRNRKMSTFTYDTAARGAPPPKLTQQVRQKVVRELHTKIVESQGQLSSLVILSLPTLQQGKGVAGGDPVAFLDTMEELTAQLDHVLFVHGGEDQILTAEG